MVKRFIVVGMLGLLSLVGFGLILFAPAEASFSTSSNDIMFPAQGDDGTPSDIPEPSPTLEPFVQSDLTILAGNVQRPNGIFWHDGFLYTGCAGDFTIYRVHDTTGETTTYIAGVQNAHSLYAENNLAGEVDLWVPDFQRNAFVNVVEGPEMNMIAEDLNSPWGLDVGPDGSFFVTQLRGDNVLQVQRDGTYEEVAVDLRNPTGIAVDGDYVYVANNGSARRAIEWFDVNEAPVNEDLLQPLVQGLQNTTGVVLGPDRLLYFAYSLGTRGIVGRVDPELCRENGGCTNADVEIVLWSELAAPLAGLTLSDDLRLYVHTMFGSEIYYVQLPQDTLDRVSEVDEASGEG